ncbi:ATP-dependent RNA helicase HrpA [Aggregatibacter actinomycetemcomitans]|uniref:ATP-dependent RNA helicase HrpA n=1 Tax=Aggregatibacter actinomycetemcomitans TaxID=714 RepID=UPI0001B9F6DD|nr:ATP-dependent RNA helicase HrpA [Aggregatibacter actinomycetemcomitans]ACX82934.1 ATP-dependent helicase HrpA [Aggregatibacter actinomycetemcomitans D11S-1]KOE58094.1 ATP-dependent helicase HrpA [Aggregatibacter actinomycetemcomitans serotype c str. AAS4A]KOE59247.1 ATP-dependent helicase HrpA [Aggregatibacter actinomycetemcomitans serotype c str. D17P-2]KYK73005.1 RNA helicase [Aggregatibacter actinomycetemcomitans serotype e str. SA2149]KYK81803.1 RNA helicase [Aggregatibacter actinomycet
MNKRTIKQELNPLQQSLFTQLNDVMLSDKRRLSARIHGIGKIKNQDAQQAVTAEIEQQIHLAKLRVEQRKSAVKNLIVFPESLPVSQRKAEIEKLLSEHQVIVVAGETGSGKTTQLPKICLELGLGNFGMIGHTQPRRIAARSVAVRIAEELQTELGDLVGYKVRFNDQISDNTQIKLMTDGILLAEIQTDRFLNQYACLIIDEAHERSLNNDFILGYLKQLLPRRPDLKLIITSATIDVERFSKHFDNAPIIEVSGRTYPVEVRYRPIAEEDDQDQLQGILNAVDELQAEGRGDILIFMNGEREIRDTAEALQKQNLKHTEILPLFARLSAQEQNKIFHPSGLNRIVLATNVAETSLTVPGIKYVIDPGTARISRYSYRIKVQRLPIEPISQASANQRKGRCGRVSEGICIRLYSEEDFNNRPEFTDPEILRTNLASVILQMTALGLDDIEAFPFVDAPDKRHIQDGVKLLEELGAFETVKTKFGEKRQLTQIGRQLAQLPVDPRLAKMLLSAVNFGSVYEVMIIVSALSIQDPRERPTEKQQAADEKNRRFADKKSDFLAFLNLWNYLQEQQKALSKNQFRRQCQKDFLNYLRIREWQDIYQQIRLAVREMGLPINSEKAEYQQIHTALLSGLLSHIGLKEAEKQQYLGARNAHFAIFPNSVLFKKKPKWVMAAELVETSKLWGRMVAEIEPEWIEPLAEHLVKKSYSEPRWSKSRGAVIADEKVSLYGVPIVAARPVNYSAIDPVVNREIFIQSALVEGDWNTKHPFFKQNQQLIREVEELEHKSRRRDILVDERTLFEFYDQRIGTDVVSQKHFDTWWKKASKQDPELLNFERSFLINDDAEQVSKLDFPNFWHQGNLKLKLTYQFEPGTDADGVTVHIPLPLLNQVEMTGFDWQIPGLREELVIALIKSLPKSYRRNFVPAPNYAQAFLGRAVPLEKPLLDTLIYELRRMTGVTVEAEHWNWAQIPSHLKMTFRVVDEKGKKIAESMDLDALKFELKDRVQESISAVADDGIEQSGAHIWNFADLPQFYEQKKQGFSVKAFPAIVDEKDAVGVKLFETEFEQAVAMQQGLRRLLLLNVPSPIKYLHEKLPNKSKLGLYFTPFGRVMDLIDDCIACAVDKLIADFGGFVWNEEGFEKLRDFVRENLNDVTVDIAQKVEQILTLTHQLNQRLKGKMDFTMAFALSDIKSQLSGLVYQGFVQKSGYHRLPDLLRYLQAIDKRIDKLSQDVNRDRAAMLRVEQVQQAYQQLLAKLPKSKPISDEVAEIRYMIEELRVSLFAQQLGTKYQVSEKRVLNTIGTF